MTIQKITKEAAASFGARSDIGGGPADVGLTGGLPVEANSKQALGVGLVGGGLAAGFLVWLVMTLLNGSADVFLDIGPQGVTTEGLDTGFNFN